MDCTAKVIVNVQVFFFLFYYEVQDNNKKFKQFIVSSGFIQASLSKIQGHFQDILNTLLQFSRTYSL